MQASVKTMSVWKELKESKDVIEIASLLAVSTVRASQILNTGKGSVTQISCIQKFYSNRKKDIATIENDNN